MSGHSQFALLTQRRFLPFFVTQCFGAFNDNIYRQAIIGLLFWIGVGTEQRTLYTNLAPALFILPYFLFSATAGQIAEKLEKSRLIRITTAMEIGIMSLAAIGFLTQNMPVLLVALFCTGLQSTLFGPVKYSILPSVLHPRELTGGNGLVEMGTSLSILVGMISGGLIFKLAGDHGPIVAATAIIALAVTGNLVSRAIPRVDASAPELEIDWNPWRESLVILRLARKQLAVRNAVLGVSWFWFVGTVLTAQLPTYAEVNLGGAETLYVFALALFSIGTGVGSILCEKLSARTVEIGLVPLGAFGMTGFIIDLYFARSGVAPVSGLAVMDFVRQPGTWRIVMDLVGIGFSAGLFVVPLFALIQSRTPKRELSRVIAALNIQNAGFIVLATILSIAVQRFLGWSIPQVFLALGIATALVAIYIFTIVPEFLMRLFSWVLVRALYLLRTDGVDRLPEEGAAMIVCNHVSYMDPLLLSAAIPRPVRFVMDHRIYRIPVLHWIFRQARAIPIAGAKDDPEMLARAFEAIERALADGELVGIFPEGSLTRDGEIAPFRAGLERVLQQYPVPVVPMALRGMWSSMWSRRDARLHRMRVPRRFRARVELVVGDVLDGRDATAEILEQRVRELRGDSR